MSLVILQRGPSSRSMARIVRRASRNATGIACGIRFDRGLSPSVSATTILAEVGPRHLNVSSRCTISARRGIGAECASLLLLSTQRRLHSAMPNDYYDYDDGRDSKSTSASATSAKPFLLADIGEGIAEVELLRWFVEEGQEISEFDPVCEVQSDKATVEITSRYEGTVQKLAYSSTGNMIQVGEPILWILEKEGPEMLEDDQEEPQPSTEAATSSFLLSPENSFSVLQTTGGSAISPEGRSMPETKQKLSSVDVVAAQEQGMGDSSVPSAFKKVLTSPAVRKLARDHGIDLSTVTGTGPAGRISKGDVLAIAKISVPYTEMEDSSVSSKQSTTTNTIGISKNVEEWNRPLEEDTMVPLRGYNRIMADTMTASLQIPHMVYSDEINLNRFVGYKMEQQQLDSQNRLGENSKKLLFLPLAIKAVSKALEEYPWLNASYDDANHEATLWKDHNIGIAMDTPRGLIVPVIKECQNKSLPELAEDLTRLKASVMEGGGGLAATDLKDATFTLSNVGAIGGGGTYMSPIITPPQVAIGALGQIRRLPRFVAPSSTDPTQSQTIEEAHICAVSWAADHRIVDGATVARFHKSFKEYMEDPIKLLLELR